MKKKILWIIGGLGFFAVIGIGFLWWLGNPKTNLENQDLVAERLLSLVEKALEQKGQSLIDDKNRLSPLNIAREDLNLVEAETNNRQQYQKNLQQAITNYEIGRQATEADWLLRYIENDEVAALTSLLQAAQKQAIFFETLKQMPVPQDAANPHWELIKNLAILIPVTQAMSQVDREPILALQSAQKFTAPYFSLIKQLIILRDYLRENKLDLQLNSAAWLPLKD